MRLFFALTPDAAAVAQLEVAATGLRLPLNANLVPSENFHITLAFIGEAMGEMLPAMRNIGIAEQMQRMCICIDRCEYWAQSRVVVATAARATPRLAALANYLQGALAANHMGGFETVWRPHVTLARKVLQAPVFQTMLPICWNADSFSLMCSARSGSRSVYTVVDTWPLLDKESKP